MINHLEKHVLINDTQHGFVKNKSCLTNLLPPDVPAHNILHAALCQPVAGQMPCPQLEASTWSAKEDLNTTGGRGSRVHNRLAVQVIGAGSLVVEVAIRPSLVKRSTE